MSVSRPGPIADVVVDAQAVAVFLRQHPDFFLRYADLLSDLELPHSRAGDTISLIERQVDGLRQKNASQQVQLEQLVFHAKENELRQQRLMRFFISLSALT